jgi:hypothetical protein
MSGIKSSKILLKQFFTKPGAGSVQPFKTNLLSL